MTAARVLNPAVISEFCKVRASPAAISCGRQQLNRIKRDLFGAVNPAEVNKTFNEELEKHQEKAINKWGFDFRTGTPLAANSQFTWERVSFKESAFAPEMYTLTRAAHVRPTPAQPSPMDIVLNDRADRENLTLNHSLSSSIDTDSCDESQDESMVVFKVPAGPGLPSTTLAVPSSTRQLRKRQPKITEYMKERKRLAQTPKKFSPAAKRVRLSPSGASSSAANGSSTANSSATGPVSHTPNLRSITGHFTLRSLHRQP